MTPATQIAAIAFGALALGTGAVTVMTPDLQDLEVPAVAWEAGSSLDGRTFHTVDTILETGEQLTDTLLFENGTFQSAKCQVYCDFGWTPYQTWEADGITHFTATTRCPEAPHTVVWYGQVSDDTVSFEATWTTRRWYWSRQMTANGNGSTTPPVKEAPSG